MSEKPVFRIPEIDDRKLFTVASLFAGGGGSSLGYKMAGGDVLYANEFIEAARDTYSANFPNTQVDPRDVRLVQPEDILAKIGLRAGELDILDGSPPCESFSQSGVLESGWNRVREYSGKFQRTDDLFFEYVRILRGLKPKVFVAENVSGLAKGVSKGYFKMIYKALLESGYDVIVKEVDAQFLGVPQIRKRVVFVGVRSDLNKRPAFPKPLPYYYGLKDVFPYMVRYCAGGYAGRWKDASLPYGTVTKSGARLTKTAYKSANGYVEALEGGKIVRRKFTIDELKTICGFPADFKLTGTFDQQWERLGNAVPPLMMYHVARTIYESVLKE